MSLSVLHSKKRVLFLLPRTQTNKKITTTLLSPALQQHFVDVLRPAFLRTKENQNPTNVRRVTMRLNADAFAGGWADGSWRDTQNETPETMLARLLCTPWLGRNCSWQTCLAYDKGGSKLESGNAGTAHASESHQPPLGHFEGRRRSLPLVSNVAVSNHSPSPPPPSPPPPSSCLNAGP